MLNKFYNSIEHILMNKEFLDIQLKELSLLLSTSLMTSEFKICCIEQVLSSIEECKKNSVAWSAPRFYYHEKLKFSVRMVYWPAFYENNPHQHKTWGVTGIFHSKLQVRTYDLLSNPTKLKLSKKIDASEAQAGYLIPGCIHNIVNPTYELSASLHIFNNIDVDHPEENAIWYPAPRKYNLSQGLLERALSVLLEVIININHHKVFKMIEQIYRLASPLLKLKAIKAMYQFDRIMARQYFNELEESL